MSFAEGCPICSFEQESTDKKVLLNAGWIETSNHKFICFDCADDITTKKFQASPAFFLDLFKQIHNDLRSIKEHVCLETYVKTDFEGKYREIIRSSCVNCGEKYCENFYINDMGKPQCCACHVDFDRDDFDHDSLCGYCEIVSERRKAIASQPEPPPKDKGVQVTPSLLQWLDFCVRADLIDKNIAESVKQLILARDKYGFNKYGQHLMTCDGRDTQEDALQELGDLLQYIHKAKMNKENIEKVKDLLSVLTLITQHFSI